MFPGFIEQHLHPFLGALTIAISMIAPEEWVLPEKTWPAAKDPEDYLAKLKAEFAAHEDPNEVFWTWGYHQYFHGEINRAILAEISTTTLIGIFHRSCHEFYTNTAFLERFDITEEDLSKSSKNTIKNNVPYIVAKPRNAAFGG